MIVNVPNIGEVNFPDGMSQEDVLSAVQELTSKGGEKTNEDEISNQPQAYSQGNARREANQQVAPFGFEEGLQTRMFMPSQEQEQRQRDDYADQGQEVTPSAAGEVQPPPADYRFEEPVAPFKYTPPSRGPEKLDVAPPRGMMVLPEDQQTEEETAPEEADTQSNFIEDAASASEDFAINVLSKMEQGSNKGMAGIARTLEHVGIPHDLTQYFEGAEEGAVTDWKILAGVQPPEPGTAQDVATSVVATVAKLPAYALSGPVGVSAGLLEGYGNSKEEYRNKLIASGESEQEANKKSTIRATLSTAAAIPLYMIGGAGAKAISAKMPQIQSELAKKAMQGGVNFALNTVSSMANRAVGAALAGEDPVAAAKNLSLEGALQDAFFAIHSTVTNFKELADAGQVKKALQGLPDSTLNIIANHPKSKYRAMAKNEARTRGIIRASQSLSNDSKKTDLPLTSETIKETIGSPVPEQAVEGGVPTITLEAQPPKPKAPVAPAAEPRIGAASWKNPRTGSIFWGRNHQEALSNARLAAADPNKQDLVSPQDLPTQDTRIPANRETPDFGYVTTQGKFVSRDEGQAIAEKTGQFKGKQTDRPVMHSNEVEMDFKTDKSSVLRDKLKELQMLGEGAPPPEAPEARGFWNNLVDTTGMSLQEMRQLGVKGAAERFAVVTKNLVTGTKEAINVMADYFMGVTLPKLRLTNAFEEATASAYSKGTVKLMVENAISEVFPNKYQDKEAERNIQELKRAYKRAERELKIEENKKGSTATSTKPFRDAVNELGDKLSEALRDADKMSRTMDIIVKDNILGGYDEIVRNINEISTILHDLKKTYEAGEGDKTTKSEIRAAEQNLKTLEEARYLITKNHDLDQYGKDVEAARGTDIEDDINRWKEIVNPIMDQLYIKANNAPTAPPTQRGRVFGARVNLLAKESESRFKSDDYEKEDGMMPSVIGAEYRNPDLKQDMLARRAIFSSQYSTDPYAILMNSFGRRYMEGTKLDFYKKLVSEGHAILANPSEEPPKSDLFGGQPVKRMEISDWPEFDPKTRSVKRTNKVLYVRNDLYPEINQVLGASLAPDRFKVFDAFTAVQLASPTDAIIHSKNLMALASFAYGRESALHDIVFGNVFLGVPSGIMELRKVFNELEKDGPEIRKEKYEIAQLAGLRPHFDKGTLMAKLQRPSHDFLRKADLATRILLNRRFDNLVKRGLVENTKMDRADYINQVGEYNRQVMNRLEAQFRDLGFSPFVVAGRAMNRFSRNMILSMLTGNFGFKPKDKKAAMEVRATRAATIGLVAAIPSLINLITTGSMFGRPGTPIGAIDFGPAMDTEDGKRRGMDLLQLMNMRRGFRQLGIDAAYNGIRNGESFDQIVGNVANDAFVVSAHPFMGPALGLAISAIRGERVDLRSGFESTPIAREIPGMMGAAERVRAAFKEQNKFVYNLGPGYLMEKGMEQYGIPRPAEMNQSALLEKLGLPEGIPIVQQLVDVGATISGATGIKTYSTPALKIASQLSKHSAYTPEEDRRWEYRSKVIRLEKAGKQQEAEDLKQDAFDKGFLTNADIKTLKFKQRHPDILEQRTTRNAHTPEDALNIYRVSQPDEQDVIRKVVLGKIINSTTHTDLEKAKYIKEFNSLAKKGTEGYNMPYDNPRYDIERFKTK
jgi:hypothetical protein